MTFYKQIEISELTLQSLESSQLKIPYKNIKYTKTG